MPLGLTVREIETVLVMMPDVPVMVIVEVPITAALAAVRVNVLVFVVLTGLKEAITPLGNPDADKATLLLKPFKGTTAMVFVPLPACVRVMLFAVVER